MWRPILTVCLLFLLFGGCTDKIPIDNQPPEASDTETLSSAAADVETDTAVDSKFDTDTDTDTGTDTNTDTDMGTYWRTVSLRFAWIAEEAEFTGTKDTALATCDGTTIVTVSQPFALAARERGTGRLTDGRMINLSYCECGDGFDCFVELDDTFPWGMGSRNNPLALFVSISANEDDIPFGKVVYCPELAGLALPDGGVHDGCLRTDDVPSGPKSSQIDWFVGLNEYYERLEPQIPEQVTFNEDAQRCAYL
jgi:hypothetical protein